MRSSHDEVLNFWFRELGPPDWFMAGEKLDPVVRTRFGLLHEAAARGDLDDWANSPLSRLALILIHDQFSRHIHRGTARAFACDSKALKLTLGGLEAGMDRNLTFSQRHFFYMPLMHSEDMAMQDKSMVLYRSLKEDAENILRFAQSHREEIEAFGRFPARNEALARASSANEIAFLNS